MTPRPFLLFAFPRFVSHGLAWLLAVMLIGPLRVSAQGPANESGLQKKLGKIMLYEVLFDETPFYTAVEFLRAKSVEMDVVEPDPSKKGVNYVIRGFSPSGAQPSVNLSLGVPTPLSEVIRLTAAAAGIDCTFDGNAIVFQPTQPGGPALPRPIASPDPRGVLYQETKLAAISLPAVEFFEATLADALAFLTQSAIAYDVVEKDPLKKGLNLVILSKNPAVGARQVTLELANVSLGEGLRHTLALAGLEYTVSDAAVLLHDPGLIKRREVIPLRSTNGKIIEGKVASVDGQIATIERLGKSFEIGFSVLDSVSVERVLAHAPSRAVPSPAPGPGPAPAPAPTPATGSGGAEIIMIATEEGRVASLAPKGLSWTGPVVAMPDGDGSWRVDDPRSPTAGNIGQLRAISYFGGDRTWFAGDNGVSWREAGPAGDSREFAAGASGLPSKPIAGIFLEESKRIWVNSWGDGIAYLEGYGGPGAAATNPLEKWRRLSTPDGLCYDDVNGFAEDAQGRLWVGTDLGVSIWDGEKFLTDGVVPQLAGLNVKSITNDSEGRVYLGAIGALIIVHPNNTVTILDPASGLPQRTPQAVFIDSRNRIWAGTWGGGVVQVERGEFKISGELALPQAGMVGKICEDKSGVIWVASLSTGLWKLDGETWAQVPVPQGFESVRLVAVTPAGVHSRFLARD